MLSVVFHVSCKDALQCKAPQHPASAVAKPLDCNNFGVKAGTCNHSLSNEVVVSLIQILNPAGCHSEWLSDSCTAGEPLE